MLRFTLDPAACRVVGLWLFFPGAVMAPFLFWQSFAVGMVFLIVWSLLSLWFVPLHARSLEGSISLGEVRVRRGILFKFSRRIPTRFITGSCRLGTPLLRSCHCSLVVLYTSGTLLLLPGLSDQNADQLLSLLEVGRP